MQNVFDWTKDPTIIPSVKRLPFYNDEPKLFQYVAEITWVGKSNDIIRGHGTDLLRESAAQKAIAEAIERICLQDITSFTIVNSELSDAPCPFADPLTFQAFTPKQLASDGFQEITAVEKSRYNWIVCTNVITGRPIWLPAQLVICPYDLSKERVIRFPSSNGAALGLSEAEAKVRAVLEVVERDAFMCWYLAAKPAQLIFLDNLSEGDELRKLQLYYERYKLDLKFLLLDTEWRFPVALAVIIDRTGVGPGLTIGMKCHPDLRTSLKGSLAEAQQMRPWLRDYIQLHGLPEFKDQHEITDAWKRALFWAKPGRFSDIETLWLSATPKPLPTIKDHGQLTATSGECDWEVVWDSILDHARDLGLDIYVADVTGALGAKLGVKVVKAVVPHTHPIYMDERYPYFNSKSLMAAVETFGPRWGVNPDLSECRIPPHPFA